MVKPKRSFHAVVSELIEGLRTGEIKLRDDPNGASSVPDVPVSGSADGGVRTTSAHPPTGEGVPARGAGSTTRPLESPRQRES